MDPHVRWLRHVLAKSAARLIGLWFGAATVVAYLALVVFTDGGLLGLVPWALVVGQLVVIVGLARAVLSNPLSYPYLRSHGPEPRRYELCDEQPDPALVERFAKHRLHPLITIRESDGEEPLFDLFQTPKQTVTVAYERLTGATAALSRFADGRILLTDSVLTVPHRRLVVNVAVGADGIEVVEDLNRLIGAHREMIDAIRDQGGVLAADDGFVFIEALAIEHDALLTVGPVLGPFLNLSQESMPLRFLGTIEPGTVSDLALRPGSPSDTPSTGADPDGGGSVAGSPDGGRPEGGSAQGAPSVGAAPGP